VLHLQTSNPQLRAPPASLAIASRQAHRLARSRVGGVGGKGNSNSHGARPVHLINTMIKWNRTSRLSIKNYNYLGGCSHSTEADIERSVFDISQHPVERQELRSEAGSCLRLIDFVYHSTLALRVIKKKKEEELCASKMCHWHLCITPGTR